MKKQLMFKINQIIQFAWLALIKAIMSIENKTKALFKRQEVRIILLMLLVLIIFIAFGFVPATSGSGGGGG